MDDAKFQKMMDALAWIIDECCTGQLGPYREAAEKIKAAMAARDCESNFGEFIAWFEGE
jgi:hypothetical protein